MLNFNEWLKTDDGATAMSNWDNAGDYDENEYDVYMKDKYEEYKVLIEEGIIK